MRFHQPAPGIALLTFPTQGEMCRTFVRVQEFYESKYEDIRGKHFTLEQFEARYRPDHSGEFSYFSDWWGFNVPGDVVTRFYDLFGADLRAEERALQLAVRNTERTKDGRFYMIGSCPTGKDDATDHEIAHALFYLEPEYMVRSAECVRALRFAQPYLMGRLIEYLLDRGYSELFLVDELQAYLATTDVSYWNEKLGLIDGANAYAIGARLRELFAAFKP